MSLENLELDGRGPIYLQIVRFVRRGVVAGTIQDGEEMPSRRAVSALLGVNPNTVQKAYRLLEEEGVLVSRAGARSCVQVDGAQVARIREEQGGSSPRAWGKFMLTCGGPNVYRFIPTCVGQMGGCCAVRQLQDGSSPRAWGK